MPLCTRIGRLLLLGGLGMDEKTDIVDRLRASAAQIQAIWPHHPTGPLLEAAEEIERLRAQVKMLSSISLSDGYVTTEELVSETCSTCTHWDTKDYEAKRWDDYGNEISFPKLRLCLNPKIPFVFNEGDPIRIPPEDGAAVNDGSGYMAVFITTAPFGCKLWESSDD